MRFSYTYIFIALVCSLPISVHAFDIPTDFTFQKNLKQGDTTNPDVSYLQYVLNQDTDTEIAKTGAGSLQNLTNFFGNKTKEAVIKFQEKFRSDILTPANITTPTGVVGERTRIKLNQILSSLFSGTYVSTSSKTPTASSLAQSKEETAPKVFLSTLTNLGTSTTQSTVRQAPVISSFSVFKAVSGQLMSIFGARFHPTKNTLYLGSQKIGDYPSLDNGTKITFKVPTYLETGSYEVGLVNAYGTTSTGYVYLNVIKPTASSTSNTTSPLTFEPMLTTVYPNTSTNFNDVIFIYGENFALQNTLETNLGNISVRSTNRKTFSFMPSELPYYNEAFKKYRGQSINLLLKVRNENGLSKQQLVHVIRFPNATSPTVNTSDQTPPAQFNIPSEDLFSVAYRRQFGYLEDAQNTVERSSSTSSSTSTTYSNQNTSSDTSGGTAASNKNSSSMQPDPATQELANLASQDPALQALRQISPVHKFATDPLVGGSSNNSSGGSGGAAAGLGIAAGGMAGGANGGTSAGGAGGITHFGGKITQVTYCTCSGAILLGIQDIASKQTLQVFFRYGQSTLHANYNIFTSGINVLGGLTPGGGQCQIYAGTSCTTQGNADYTIDTIRGVGTGATSGL